VTARQEIGIQNTGSMRRMRRSMICSFPSSLTTSIQCSKMVNHIQAYVKRPRRALHSWRSPSTYSYQRFPGRAIVVLCTASIGFGLGYHHFGAQNALILEASDSFRTRMLQEGGSDIKTLTPWIPYTMEDIDEYLRTRESIYVPRPSWGVLRADVTQLEGNSPIEDSICHLAKQFDSRGRRWLYLGVFDGHE